MSNRNNMHPTNLKSECGDKCSHSLTIPTFAGLGDRPSGKKPHPVCDPAGNSPRTVRKHVFLGITNERACVFQPKQDRCLLSCSSLPHWITMPTG